MSAKRLGLFVSTLTLLASATASMAITIAQARLEPLGTVVTIEGAVIVSATDLINSANSKGFQIQDATGGLTVHGNNADIDPLLAIAGEGDEITITGTTGTFNGLFQLVVPSLSVIKTGSPGLPAPTLVTTADFVDNSPTAEGHESKLVKLVNGSAGVQFTHVLSGSTWNALAPGAKFAGVTSYRVTDVGGSGVALVRVSTGQLNLIGVTIPTAPIMVTGVFSQFDSTDPRTGDYQLLVRSLADIQYVGNAVPSADTLSVTANKGGTAVTITLPATDPDASPAALTYSITSRPVRQFPTVDAAVLGGTLKDAANNNDLTNGGALSGNGNQVIFTPSAGVSGWFAFTFRAYDGSDYSNDGVINLFVQDSGKVVITEIMYDPANLTDNNWEWVEVTNVSGAGVALHSIFDSWLKGTVGTEHNLQSQVLAAGATKVITVNNNASRTLQQFLDEWNPSARSPAPPLEASDLIIIDSVSGARLPALDNAGDTVYLFADDGSLLDVVKYEAGTNGWPQNNNRGSIFLEADKLNTLDNDLGTNWRLSVPGVSVAYATVETIGPPADSDVGSPALLPNAPTLPATSPAVEDATFYHNEGGGALLITLIGKDTQGQPMNQTFKLLSGVEGVAPTSGSGGTLVDPDNGFAVVGAGSVLGGNQVLFSPAPGKSGRFALGFVLNDGTADSNTGYITIYVQALNKVVITEVMYDSSQANENSWEWIEVANLTGSDIQLHSLLDTATETITSGGAFGKLTGMTVPANSVRVITPVDVNKSLNDFLTYWSPLTADKVFTVPTTSSTQEWRALNNDGDDLYLYGADGSLLDVLRYTSGSGWPTRNNSSSIYLKQSSYSSVANDSGANWLRSAEGVDNAWASAGPTIDVGSPGLRPSDAPLPVLVFDFNGDGAVDLLNDLAVLNACALGAGVARPATAACQRADYDGDGDVDMVDYASFQRCIQSAGDTPAAGCLR